MKLGQTLVCCMANISNMFELNTGDWKLVPGPFPKAGKKLFGTENRNLKPHFLVLIFL